MTFKLAKVIGHRGACGYAPENTLISMSKAHELGAQWVEFDVMLAQTGEPIIIHDLTLDRTTNGTGHVVETDWTTLSGLDCGEWFSKDYAGQKIPMLADLLSHVSRLNLGINVEIKPHPGYEVVTTHKTIQVLRSHWPATCQIPLISSFSPLVLQTVIESKINCKLGYIVDTWASDWEKTIKQFNCFSLHIDHNLLTSAKIKKIKEFGLSILAYTVNDVPRAQQLFDWGIDSVFTDYPDLILSGIGETKVVANLNRLYT